MAGLSLPYSVDERDPRKSTSVKRIVLRGPTLRLSRGPAGAAKRRRQGRRLEPVVRRRQRQNYPRLFNVGKHEAKPSTGAHRAKRDRTCLLKDKPETRNTRARGVATRTCTARKPTLNARVCEQTCATPVRDMKPKMRRPST